MECYPFGWEMPGRKYNSNNYRYGFNGKEKDDEGEFGSITNYDYGFRIYNPAIGRFLSVDPLTGSYPHYTPYQFAGNKPIQSIDVDGLEEFEVTGVDNNSATVYGPYKNQETAQDAFDSGNVFTAFNLPEAEVSTPSNETLTSNILNSIGGKGKRISNFSVGLNGVLGLGRGIEKGVLSDGEYEVPYIQYRYSRGFDIGLSINLGQIEGLNDDFTLNDLGGEGGEDSGSIFFLGYSTSQEFGGDSDIYGTPYIYHPDNLIFPRSKIAPNLYKEFAISIDISPFNFGAAETQTFTKFGVPKKIISVEKLMEKNRDIINTLPTTEFLKY